MPRDLTAPWTAPETKPALDADGEVLWRAADLLAERGHCKKTVEDAYGRHCLYGAINIARRGSAYATGDYTTGRWDADARRLGFSGFEKAVLWNNEPQRTAAEVIARLRAAARGEL